jgi:creatinine amidohydrolase
MTELAKLAWPEVAALLQRGCAAILPVGATEAHGPHLPLDTDVTIASGMARRAAERLAAAGHPTVVLPPIAYSVTDYAAPFAGTLGLSTRTAQAHVREVLTAAVCAGFAPVAIANAHLEPAHVASLRAAVEEVAAQTGVLVVFPDVTRRRLAERLTEEFRSGACHAGRYESSLVLADDPASVKDELRRELPPVPVSLVDAIAAGQGDFLAAGGTRAYFGWPADATPEEGQATFEILATLLVEALDAARSGGG